MLGSLLLAACGHPPPPPDGHTSSETLARASSRPERGVPVSYAWDDLHQKSTNALRRLLERWGGRTFTLGAVAYDGETTVYDSFRVRRATRLTVRDETGQELEVHFYGSTFVQGDQHRVFSYVVD